MIWNQPFKQTLRLCSVPGTANGAGQGIINSREKLFVVSAFRT
jgi:hypothetical protein